VRERETCAPRNPPPFLPSTVSGLNFPPFPSPPFNQTRALPQLICPACYPLDLARCLLSLLSKYLLPLSSLATQHLTRRRNPTCLLLARSSPFTFIFLSLLFLLLLPLSRHNLILSLLWNRHQFCRRNRLIRFPKVLFSVGRVSFSSNYLPSRQLTSTFNHNKVRLFFSSFFLFFFSFFLFLKLVNH